VTRAPLGQATCSEVSSQTNVNRTAVTGDHRLREDLGIDSLSLIDVAVAAEDRFGIRIPDKDLECLQAVGDMLDYIRRAKVGA
jgi:acyl carrier protein